MAIPEGEVGSFYSPFEGEKNRFVHMVNYYDMGGKAISDTSTGTTSHNWECWLDGDDVFLKRLPQDGDSPADPALLPQRMFSKPNLREVSFSFDSNNFPHFTYVDNQGGWVRWFNPVEDDYTDIFLGSDVRNPRMTMDDKRLVTTNNYLTNDFYVFYLRDTSLYFRTLRDRFSTEIFYCDAPPTELIKVGMNSGFRLQFMFKAILPDGRFIELEDGTAFKPYIQKLEVLIQPVDDVNPINNGYFIPLGLDLVKLSPSELWLYGTPRRFGNGYYVSLNASYEDEVIYTGTIPLNIVPVLGVIDRFLESNTKLFSRGENRIRLTGYYVTDDKPTGDTGTEQQFLSFVVPPEVRGLISITVIPPELREEGEEDLNILVDIDESCPMGIYAITVNFRLLINSQWINTTAYFYVPVEEDPLTIDP